MHHSTPSDVVYDKLAEEYDNFYSAHIQHTAKILPQIMLQLTKGRVQKIFDIGAGTGAATIPLAVAGNTVVSLDNSADMLKIIRRKAGALNIQDRIAIVQADILEEDLPAILVGGDKTYFDGVIFWGNGLCHIHPADYQRLVRNISELLKPDGWVLFNYGLGIEELNNSTHLTILKEDEREVYIRCLHGIPKHGYGPFHGALIKLSLSDTPSMAFQHGSLPESSISVFSAWPYLVDKEEVRKVFRENGFSDPINLDFKDSPLDMITEVYTAI